MDAELRDLERLKDQSIADNERYWTAMLRAGLWEPRKDDWILLGMAQNHGCWCTLCLDSPVWAVIETTQPTYVLPSLTHGFLATCSKHRGGLMAPVYLNRPILAVRRES